jgi:hypothetical protein
MSYKQLVYSTIVLILNKCTEAQKIAVLHSIDSNADANSLFTKINNKIRGCSFFNILKTLTVEGYCSSKIGTTKLSAYLAVLPN